MQLALLMCECCNYIWSDTIVVDICPRCKEIASKVINKRCWEISQKEALNAKSKTL